MKKPIIVIACLALCSCVTETPTPVVAPKPDPCLDIQWIQGYELNCGPGKFFCLAEVKPIEDGRCQLWCGMYSYPTDWVEMDDGHSYIKIHDEYTTDVQLCLVRKK